MKQVLQRISRPASRSASPDTRQSAKSGLILALKTARDAGDNVPGAAMIFGGILSVIEGLDKSKANAKTLQELEDQVQSLKTMFPDLKTLELDGDVQQFADQLDVHLKELEKKHRHSHFLSVVNATYDEEDLRSISERIRNLLIRFQTRMITRREDRENIREERERLREIFSRLDALPRADNASFDSDRPNKPIACFPGTRTKVLDDIKIWTKTTGHDVPSVFWVNGIAGIGKSTIAQNVAEEAHAEGITVASFFFSRMEAERSSSNRVIPTIAYQLAQLDTTFRLHLGDGLKDPLGHVGLSRQMERLLIEPLSKIKTSKTVLIVLDALDECDNAGAEELLRLLPILFSKISFPLRIFITSRPERHIHTAFERSSNYPTIILHDIESSIVKADVRLYLKAMLQRISESRHLSPDWFAKDFEKLASRADKLFIYAATAYRFLDDDMPSPPDRLKILLDPSPSSDKNAAHADLDQLYTQVLLSALSNRSGKYLESTLEIYQDVVGSIVHLRDPLPMTALSHLINHKPPLEDVISRLHSVIVLPPHEAEATPSIYHPSFPDFITNPERCTERKLLIDRTTHERRLTICCLKILTTQLKRDMADIRDPSLLNKEVPDLSDRVKKIFTPELRYVCLHWSSHLCALPKDEKNVELWGLLKDFTSRCILWWFEAMSLLDRSVFSSSCIGNAHLWTLESNHDPWTTSILHGGHRLILTHLNPIGLAALHVYHSALPFTPRGSSVWDSYQQETKDTAHIIQGVPQQWPACMKTILGHENYVTSVAFSPDGLRIVSGSGDETIRLWDAMSGEQILELHGHTDYIRSVTFSPDGLCIVSGSDDKTVRLWDAISGEQISEMHGHTSYVLSVSFSPDALRIVSASADKTIRLWDVTSSEQIAELHGHTGYVTSVTFSPDGLRIASGSDDNTVRLWDAISSQQSAELRGHTNLVFSVAFSPDGLRVVSASGDKTVRLWDAISGGQISELPGHNDYVRSASFSPDGLRIVSGSDDRTIRLWNSMSGEQIAELRGHTDYVNSVAFLPDGSRVVSGSDDKTIRLWDAVSGGQISEQHDHTDYVLSVAFSSDGVHVISHDANGRNVAREMPIPPPSIFLNSHHRPETNSLLTSPPVVPVTFLFKNQWLCGQLPSCLVIRLFYVPLEYVISTKIICSGANVCFGCERGQVLVLNLSRHPIFSPVDS